MKKYIKFFKYLIEFIVIIIFYFIFKILGLKISTFISRKIFNIFGSIFRSKKVISKNLKIAFPKITEIEIENFTNKMWNYYGEIFVEYLFLKKFRYGDLNKNIEVVGQHILDEIKSKGESVIFISGHFDNFELMAMTIEKSGIKLSAIYRPLNNFFMNKIMENLRTKYICKNQIKKGRSSLRDLLRLFNNGSSIALMIDQRVSEGIKSKFFNKDAYTTTIPAQFVKKFNCKVVPINIERKQNSKFKLTVYNPITFNDNDSIENITHNLNLWLEKIITNNPSKWIWSHDRWK